MMFIFPFVSSQLVLVNVQILSATGGLDEGERNCESSMPKRGMREKPGADYEANEGARGSKAVRQRNCQDWIRSRLASRGTKEEIVCSGRIGICARATGVPNPSVPGWTFTRRVQRRTAESNALWAEGDWCLPLSAAENEQEKLSSRRELVGSPKQSADTSMNNAGITATKMTFTRLIFSWTRLVFERSIRPFADYDCSKHAST